MTRKEAIEVLQASSIKQMSLTKIIVNNKFLSVKTALEMAIKALEQEPKTVLYSGDGYADGYMVYDMAECPNCGYEYEEGDKDWGLPFCPNCGQSLNWESEEENEDSN